MLWLVSVVLKLFSVIFGALPATPTPNEIYQETNEIRTAVAEVRVGTQISPSQATPPNPGVFA